MKIEQEQHSDHPAGASPVISEFLRVWNATLGDYTRQFLTPYAIRVIGTAATPDIETRRAWLAADWFMRTYLPAWLELAGFAEEANQIRALPEFTGATELPMLEVALQIMTAPLSAVRSASRGATQYASELVCGRDAIWLDVERAVWRAAEHEISLTAPGDAARLAAVRAWPSDERRVAVMEVMSVAMHASRDAAVSAAMSAVAAGAAAEYASLSEAERAAKSVAESAARSALQPTVDRLMESAVELLDRMIAVTG